MAFRLIQARSLEQWSSLQQEWDDLWRRSCSTMPTMRSAFLRQWMDHFCPGGALRGLMVESNGRLVAGIALRGGALGKVVAAGLLPANEWVASGDLLVDPSEDVDQVLDLLAAAMRDLPWPVVHLEAVTLDAPHYAALLGALRRSSVRAVTEPRYEVGVIDWSDSWPAYLDARSKSHRRKMTKLMNRLRRQGHVELQVHQQPDSPRLKQLLRTAFELEDRSWKGRAGTSVLRTPGMLDLLTRQAEELLAHDELHLALLVHDQRPIAFGYGWRTKGVLSSYKIGYDPAYASFSPGHLFRQELLRWYAQHSPITALDCLGPLGEATLKWATGTYRVGRMLIGTKRIAGPGLVGFYQHVWPPLRRVREIALAVRLH